MPSLPRARVGSTGVWLVGYSQHWQAVTAATLPNGYPIPAHLSALKRSSLEIKGYHLLASHRRVRSESNRLLLEPATLEPIASQGVVGVSARPLRSLAWHKKKKKINYLHLTTDRLQHLPDKRES